MSRAVMSVAPAGPNGTIKRTGRVGYACAHATRDKAGSAAAPAARRKNFRRGSFISNPPSLAVLFDHLVGERQQRLVPSAFARNLRGPEQRQRAAVRRRTRAWCPYMIGSPSSAILP